MILSNFGNSHKCLPCFTLSAHPPPAGWGIQDGKASILLEISKFLFLTCLPCFSHSPPTFFYPFPHEGTQWGAVACVARVPVFPASQSSFAGSAPQPLVLQAPPLSHMPLPGQVPASSKVTHPNPDLATLPSMFSTHHRLQNTESVSMSWENTFSTFSMHNHYTDNDGNCQFRAALNKEGGSFLLYNIIFRLKIMHVIFQDDVGPQGVFSVISSAETWQLPAWIWMYAGLHKWCLLGYVVWKKSVSNPATSYLLILHRYVIFLLFNSGPTKLDLNSEGKPEESPHASNGAGALYH